MSIGRNLVPNLIAGGTIRPRSWVTLSTAAEGKVLQASDTVKLLGVIDSGVKYPPGTVGSDDTIAVTAGDPVLLWGDGEIADLIAGAGQTITLNAPIGSDSLGLGAVVSGTTAIVGGRALTAADAGGVFKVLINTQQTKGPL